MPERQGSDRAEERSVDPRVRTDQSPGDQYRNRANRYQEVDKRGRTDETRGRGGKAARASPDELGKFLGDVDFPAGKHDLIHHAGNNGASTGLIALLERVAERQYRDLSELKDAAERVK